MKYPVKSVVWPVAALALVLSLGSSASLWELDWRLLGTEPWRLVTGHLVHWSVEHLVWDLAVFVGLGAACEMRSRRRTAWTLALAAPLIAWGAPLWTPGLETYRGLSGLDAALFTLLATRCLRGSAPAARVAGVLALVGFLGKVGWEISTGTPVFVSGLPHDQGVFVVPAAHLLGGLAGWVVGWPNGDGSQGWTTIERVSSQSGQRAMSRRKATVH